MEPTWLDTLPEETRNAIPEEYRNDQNVTKYKTMDEFFKGHKNLVETVGKKGVILPGEKADPKEWEPVYNALGRPEKPEGYKLTMPEKLHAAIKPTPESQAEFYKAAHALGLSNKAADGLNAWYLQKLSGIMTAQDEATANNRKTASELLTKEWGAEAENNLKATKAFVERIGGKDSAAAFGELGDNPTVLKFLHKLSASIGEDTINKIIGGKSVDTGTEQDQAKKAIEEIKANKAHAYWDENNAKHGEAIKEMQALYTKAYPEGA